MQLNNEKENKLSVTVKKVTLSLEFHIHKGNLLHSQQNLVTSD